MGGWRHEGAGEGMSGGGEVRGGVGGKTRRRKH